MRRCGSATTRQTTCTWGCPWTRAPRLRWVPSGGRGRMCGGVWGGRLSCCLVPVGTRSPKRHRLLSEDARLASRTPLQLLVPPPAAVQDSLHRAYDEAASGRRSPPTASGFHVVHTAGAAPWLDREGGVSIGCALPQAAPTASQKPSGHTPSCTCSAGPRLVAVPSPLVASQPRRLLLTPPPYSPRTWPRRRPPGGGVVLGALGGRCGLQPGGEAWPLHLCVRQAALCWALRLEAPAQGFWDLGLAGASHAWACACWLPGQSR